LNFPAYFLGGTIQSIFLAAGGLDLQYWTRLSMQSSYLMLLFLLLGLGVPSLSSLVGVYFVTHLISLIVAVTFSRTVLTGEAGAGRPGLRPLLRALPPLIAEAIAAKADVWAFSLFGTLAGVGQYSGLSALMIPVGLVSNALLSSSTAQLDWTQPSLVRSYLLRASIALACLCAAIGVGGTVFGPAVLSAVLGKSFAEGEWMIPWIALIVVGQATANQFHSSVQLSGLSSAFFVIQSVDSGIRLFMVTCGAWAFGEVGILIALVLSSVAKIAWSAYALFARTRGAQ
jgi:O-antigen/teichoic acid export membrane protein